MLLLSTVAVAVSSGTKYLAIYYILKCHERPYRGSELHGDKKNRIHRIKKPKVNRNPYATDMCMGHAQISSVDLRGQHCSFVARSHWNGKNNKKHHFMFQVDIIDSNIVTENNGTL